MLFMIIYLCFCKRIAPKSYNLESGKPKVIEGKEIIVEREPKIVYKDQLLMNKEQTRYPANSNIRNTHQGNSTSQYWEPQF